MDSSSLGTWVGAIASGIVGVLMWLVTNKQANISKTQLDDALRPRIFRSNYMSWGKLVGDMPLARNMSGEIDENKLIKFIAQRNEALKISGHIIINKRKYHLRFSFITDIKPVPDKANLYIPTFGDFSSNLSWIGVGNPFFCDFDTNTYEKSDAENNIKIFFEDIEGNKYEFTEDKDHSQTQRRVMHHKKCRWFCGFPQHK